MRRLFLRFLERLALNNFANGRYARAERYLKALHKHEGETQRVLRNLGLVYMAVGDYAKAGEYFRREVELFGPTSSRLQALADVAYLSGDREAAAARIAEALADPEIPNREMLTVRAALCADPEAFARAAGAREHFARGSALQASGRHQEALDAFRQAVAADPSDFAALNNLGSLLLDRADDPAGALEAFERSAQLADLPLVRVNILRARVALDKKKP